MGTFLQRYQAGEHVEVWDDLVSLGPAARHELYQKDAAAVAAETMRRVRRNVETLIGRLAGMGYRFLTMPLSDALHEDGLKRVRRMAAEAQSRIPRPIDTKEFSFPEILRSAELRQLVEASGESARAKTVEWLNANAINRKQPLENREVFAPPDKKTAQLLQKLEKMARGPLPFSLRAWFEEVGGVSLLGWHSALSPNADEPAGLSGTAVDPLLIWPPAEVLQAVKAENEGGETGGEMRVLLAPDAVFKAGEGGGDAYYMTAPSACADAIFHDDNGRSFVNYLRNAFRWGGFPGWEDSKNPPRAEIAQLSDGLLPF
jgi:hypothetical protein